MSGYTIQSVKLNKNRVFILQKSELEKRLDPFFYVPELVELEKIVLSKQPKKLRDYVKGIASGATPKRDEEEKYYSDKINGIPFLRVQNVTPFGLDLSDVKFIKKETHEGYLRRSQVNENDLLVTITGRIASASVAPKGFIGNINQHSVIIKTDNKEISEQLAAFLNCEVGQKLAIRRTTGGTRPALDYPALLSIPILNDRRILEITKKVVEQKKQNEEEAQKLLESIDDYLLGELGIKLPLPPENTLKNRIFTTSIKNLSGNRFDPLYWQGSIYGVIQKTQFPFIKIKAITKYLINGFAAGHSAQNINDEGIIQIRPTNISDNRELVFEKNIYIDNSRREKLKNDLLITGEILFNNTNSQELVGKSVYFDLEGDFFCSNHITRIALNEKAEARFLTSILNLYQRQRVFYKCCINWNNQSGVNIDILKNLQVPIPPIGKQKEIANHIIGIQQQAQQLKDKTNKALKKANTEIEKILLT